MMHQFPPSSSVSAKLLAINSAAAVALRETAAAAEDDPVENKGYSESSGSVEKEDPLLLEYSDTLMKPDVGILSKDFVKFKGREEQPVGKQFAIHRKKRAEAVDVDVGILDNRRRQQQTSRANLHAENRVVGRSLQSEEELPLMCLTKNGYGGYMFFANLFNATDSYYFTEEGYFPKCSCSRVSPTTCGPSLCECLELDADGDILKCMDPFKQLCDGTKYIEEIPGPWSMEKCLGGKENTKGLALAYCSMLPCFVDGGSYWQCKCNMYDSQCTEFRKEIPCARSKCCQAQTDDEGRQACRNGEWRNYYDQVTSLFISDEEMTSRFNECSFQSDSGKSIVECYCKSFSYGLCVNRGIQYPDMCEAMHCCYEQTEDDARLDCFTTRFRNWHTGRDFYYLLDTIQESCVASGRSSDQCKCDIQGLSNCLGNEMLEREPRCDLLQCCQSQTGDNDEGRKYCLVQDEAQIIQNEIQLRYESCLNSVGEWWGSTEESCVCYKSNSLCSSGHSNDRHCELSSCCQEKADDTGRKECIGNFTTSQPSSAPSSESIPHADTSTVSSPSTGDQVLEDSTIGTPNSSSFSLLGSEKARKALVVAAVIGWLVLT